MGLVKRCLNSGLVNMLWIWREVCWGRDSLRALCKMNRLLDSRSDKVAFEAAKDLMDRAGLGIEQEREQAKPLVINISL